MQDSLEDYLKLTRNSEQDDSLKISKEIVVSAQLKKECEVRAMKIVEFSVEGKLRPEVLVRCLPFINQAYYQDIVEERAITKLCGYSICGKRIPDMPKKQYLISTKSNKVYDITERKKFCSNFCYKASLHIKKQIENSPLWLRKLEGIPEYKLLHVCDGGLPGELVDQGMAKPVVEVTFASINSFAQASLGDITEEPEIDLGKNSGKNKNNKTKNFKKSSSLKSTMQTIKENEVEEEITASETIKSTKKIDHKRGGKITKKETHRRICIVSLPSIQENEEKLQNLKENDCGKDINVIIKQEEKECVADGAKPDQLDQERLEATKINITTEDQSQSLIENKTKLMQISGHCIQIKPEEKSIKTEPPETIKEKSIATKPKKTKKKQSTNSKVLNIENTVKNAVDSWITLETCIFIHGEEKVKQVLNERKLSDYFGELHVQELKREQQMKYMEICRRLQLQEMADEKFEKAFVGTNKLKPLPDFRKLKEDTRDLKLKVKSFYEGSMYEQDDKNFPVEVNKQNEEGDPEQGPPAVLPLMDVNSQNLLRRKIFLNSLSKSIQQMLQSLGASYSTVLSDVQALVKTFSLKADNITFKPLIWSYIALVLLDLLSIKDESLKELLEERRSQEYLKILFEGLPSKRKFVFDLVASVKDIELFVEKYITRKDSNIV